MKLAIGCVSLVVMLASSCLAAETHSHALFRAIQRGDIELVESLLRQGVPANLKTEDGTTALMLAARDSSPAVVKLLLKNGADPNQVNDRGVTALLWGAVNSQKVRLLVEHGADVPIRSVRGITPLHVATRTNGNAAAVRVLIRHGADPFPEQPTGVNALRNAVYIGDPETVDLLLELAERRELTLDAQEPDLLHVAAERGHVEIAELFIDRLEAREQKPSAATLNRALLTQKPELAIRLIEAGADLNHRLSAGKIPSILLAAYTETGDASVARLLISKGCDISRTNQFGETALTWAQRRGHSELIDVLRKAGVQEVEDKRPEIPQRGIRLDATNQRQLLTSAVTRSLGLLQHSSDRFLDQRKNCISCHHQNMPGVAMGWAEARGFSLDQASAQRMIDRQIEDWTEFIERAYQMDRPVPVAPRFLGYGLWSLSALGYADDEVTRAAVAYLAAIQSPDGRWDAGMVRPPMGGADLVATVLGMRALQLYPMQGRRAENARRIKKASQWLADQKPRYHQERVYQLLGRAWSGGSTRELQDSVDQLLKLQRDDGGWAQLSELDSDAWATGQSLVALQVAGGIPTSHPVYQKGLEFLLSTQFDDGAWFVKARSWPFQSHFDSEFPFDRDQWISAPATAWAVMAMVLAVEPSNTVVAAQRTASDDSESTRELPQPFEGEVDFVADIQPVLERSCRGCHSGDQPMSGYRVTDRESLIKGGESEEPAVVVGRSEESRLVKMVAGTAGDLVMPPAAKQGKFPPLSNEEVQRFRAWIDRGAVWPNP